jgi:1-acyl-sn-glycerol-3-phosphate acyltransferase
VLQRACRLFYQFSLILFFFPLTLFCGVGSYVAGFFDSYGNHAHRCLIYWARASLALAGLRVQIQGLERLDPESAYVFMPNHASFLDILLVFAYIPHNFRIIVKKEIFSIPFLGLATRSSGQIPLDRKNPSRGLKSLRRAADLLRQGISIVVFPEGTRTPDGKIQDFKATLFTLPIQAQVPVVPVLIEGTFQALRRGSVLLKPSRIRMTFYDPVLSESFKDRDRKNYAEKIRQLLSGSMSRLAS